jgi:ankyrin repeat protein
VTVEQDLFDAAERGDTATLAGLLDRHPDKLQVRTAPYALSLLHLAAAHGRLSTVHLLLQRGLDVNTRDEGDNSYPMHWAAARGHLDVVRALADAGADVVGSGDDHALDVIGWATCFDHCQVAIADFLVGRGARHHIFSAVAMDLPDEVRQIAAADPGAVNSRQSHNEDFRRPLHFAVLKNRPAMVELLLTLGADPLGTDRSGYVAPVYATSPDVDRPILDMIRAERGVDLFTALALGELDVAALLVRKDTPAADARDVNAGVLHLMSKRNNAAAVKWLLDQGLDVNCRWWHWDAQVTPLQLASAHGHTEVVRLLIDRGADAHIRDSKHDSDAIGWAEHFGHPEIVRILTGRAPLDRS